MKEKTQSEKIAADRQVKLLTTALEQAKENGGVWLNADRKLGPALHRKEIGISGFNGLMLALASDQHRYATNLYTFYSDARNLKSPVREHERGVPFNWYNWSKYVNKNDPNDTISREDYKKLPASEQTQYKGVKQREVRWLFNIDQTILPQAEAKRYDKLVGKYGNGEERQVPDYEKDTPLRIKVNDFQLKMDDNLVNIRHDGTGLNYYDADKNTIHISPQKTFADYPHFVQEIMRDVVAATGSRERLAREGVAGNGSVADDDAVKQEKLIQELASGVKMQELGLPARISKENMGMVDYWIRELKENPRLIDIVESDVNNALDVIKSAEQGKKIEQASKVNAQKTQEYQEQMPKHYYVVDAMRGYPDKDNKLFVLVKDPQTKSADVVLPQGASVDRDNEISGMNKDRIEHALNKQGYDTVRFYNIDGALGYKPDDSYFAGKELTVSRIKNWSLEDVSRLDASLAVEHADKMEFDRVQMIQDDNRRWALYVKPEGKAAFTVYPDKEDVNRFFTTLRQSQENIDGMRQELANKYYAMSEAKPEFKVDLFGNEQASEVDMNRILKANIFKGRNDVILCAAEIEGVGKLEPKIVSPQQWQRMWLAEDREAYKKSLAAKLYADVLQKTRPAEVKEEDKGREKETQVEVKSVYASMSPEEIYEAVNGKTFIGEGGKDMSIGIKNPQTNLTYVRMSPDGEVIHSSARAMTDAEIAHVMRSEKWIDANDYYFDKVKSLEGRAFETPDEETIYIDRVEQGSKRVLYRDQDNEPYEQSVAEFVDTMLNEIEKGKEVAYDSAVFDNKQIEVSPYADMSPHDIFLAAHKKIFAAEDGRELIVVDKNKDTGLILVRERIDHEGSNISHDEYTENQLADIMRREKWTDVTDNIIAKVKALEGRSFIMKDGNTIGITSVDVEYGCVNYTNHYGESVSERIANFSDVKLGYIEGGKEIVKKSEEKQKPQVEAKSETKGKEDTREKLPWSWQDLKKKHPTAMLMFRIGDNYQMYKEDALKGSKILGTEVQKIRDNVDMTSFPHYNLDKYLPKLIRSGCRVAICDNIPERVNEWRKQENQQAAGQEESRSRGMRR